MAQEYENKIKDEFYGINLTDLCNNDPVLGNIMVNNKIMEFKIPIKYILNNILICGDVFSGKSSIIKRLLLQIIENTNLNPIIFDINNEYDKLLDSKWLEREIWSIEFGNENFSINPLELIRENDEYLEILIDIFRDTFNLNIEESFILKEFIKYLNDNFENPTLSDLLLLFELGDEVVSIFSDDVFKKAISHLKSIITGLIHGPIKEILDVESTNLNIKNLQNFPIVIKFKGINKTGKRFIVNLFYFIQLIYKIDNPDPKPHLMVIDPIDEISYSLLLLNSRYNVNEGILASLTTPLDKKRNRFAIFTNYIFLHISSDNDINTIKEKFCNKDNELLSNLIMGQAIVNFSNKNNYKVEIDDFYF
ncbi:MAG: helicase HerA domain-containing protein [Candidatus Helarchaeota archaeon]